MVIKENCYSLKLFVSWCYKYHKIAKRVKLFFFSSFFRFKINAMHSDVFFVVVVIFRSLWIVKVYNLKNLEDICFKNVGWWDENGSFPFIFIGFKVEMVWWNVYSIRVVFIVSNKHFF